MVSFLLKNIKNSIFTSGRDNKDSSHSVNSLVYVEKVDIFKKILKSNNELNEERIKTLSQLLLNQLNSKAYSDSGKNYLLDSFINKAENGEIGKIEMMLTGKGIISSTKKPSDDKEIEEENLELLQ